MNFMLMILFLANNTWALSDLEGHYTGPVDGATGELKITEVTNTSMKVSLTLVQKGCNGDIQGIAKKSGSVFVLEKKGEDKTCKLTLTPGKDGISTSEEDCLEFHGFACNFDSVGNRFKKSAKK